MKSLKELYRIGNGPSSSHTMGPKKAAQLFLDKNPQPAKFVATLYGSLAATGKGHLTDKAILDVLEPVAPTTIEWMPKTFLPFHPNAMKFDALDAEGKNTDSWTVYSVGGGALSDGKNIVGLSESAQKDIYPMTNITDIQEWCEANGRSYWEYVRMHEDADILDYLSEVWKVMKSAVKRGLENEGVLPGPLNLQRKAASYFIKAKGYKASLQSRGLVFAYALAVSEENASGGEIVTAPTCGSCGVLPAILYHLEESRNFSEIRIIRALATAGLFGNVVKENASISGAEVGCQGEVGVACAMAAAAASQLFGGSPAQIEYAAEMGLEHHLGMTCDPVCGLVQIPCIERNAYAAARALDANLYSSFTDGIHRVSFDRVVEVMEQTGHDLPSLYKETGEGGLAKGHKFN
ncbi:MAG: L-serine ammonia-lyase [Petrimonas sp.]|nr:L-serine ammonia-lyase [Petrimonas sp.]